MPIPLGLTEKQFAVRFRGLLERHSQALLDEFRALLDKPIGDGVTSATVEIFLDEYGESSPAFGMYFEGPNKRVNHSDPSIFPGRYISLAQFVQDLEQFHPKYFTESEFRALDIQADVAKTWFAEWWWKAGGWDYPIPVELKAHDDLGNGEWIELAPGSEQSA